MKYFWITLSVCLVVDVLCNSGRVIAKIKEFINLQENQNKMDDNYWFVCYVKQSVSENLLAEALNLISQKMKPSYMIGVPQFAQEFITNDADQPICFKDPFHFIERMNAQDKESQYVLVSFQAIEEEEYECYKKINTKK